MDLSFLTLLNLLILFFILKHQKKNCIPCRYFFVSTLFIILGLYEFYMYLSYPKNDDISTNDFNTTTSALTTGSPTTTGTLRPTTTTTGTLRPTATTTTTTTRTLRPSTTTGTLRPTATTTTTTTTTRK
jgi:hypothetical protein